MSAPLIWILLPGLAGVLLYFFRRSQAAVLSACTALSGLLALAAWRLPVGRAIEIGPLAFKISDTLVILGRRFILGDNIRPVLALLFLLAAFWFLGAFLAHPGKMFGPLGLGITALMVAALAVEPFLYAALLIEMAVLLSAPLLMPPGKKASKGVLRFLTFQTIGMPFILFTGWLLASADVNPSNQSLILHAGILLAIGFGFLMAVFPFHTWIPMLTEETHPYAASFVLFMLPGIISIFGISFFDHYAWLSSSTIVYDLLRFTGTLMILAGGIWSAFQRNLGRMLGYAVIINLGLFMLLASLGGAPDGTGAGALAGTQQAWMRSLFFTLFLTNGLALGVWALALSSLRSKFADLSFKATQGFGRLQPLAAAGAILAQFSLAGFPLLAGFPARLILFENLAQADALFGWLAVIGCAGMMAGGLRSMAVAVMGADDQPVKVDESRPVAILLAIEILVLLLLGLFPSI